MKNYECGTEFFDRFNELVNQINSYGEKVSNEKMVEKIMISMLEKIDPLVAVIEETKELEKLEVEELMESLKAFKKKIKSRLQKIK